MAHFALCMYAHVNNSHIGHLCNISETIVGVNKFKLDHQDPLEVRVVDNMQVRESQINKISELRSTRNNDEVQSSISC